MGMKALLGEIRKLQGTAVKSRIDSRMSEFYAMKKRPSKDMFRELCFCLLTANWQAEGAIRIQKSMGKEFCLLPQSKLAARLREHGYRFPNVRAGFIAEAQKHQDDMKTIITSHSDSKSLREWIVSNVKGLGYKEASHFLRNIGFDDLAIIDFHIVDLLERDGLIERPKTMTPKRYLEIEDVLRSIARKAGLNLAELDLYLWYIETGKILK